MTLKNKHYDPDFSGLVEAAWADYDIQSHYGQYTADSMEPDVWADSLTCYDIRVLIDAMEALDRDLIAEAKADGVRGMGDLELWLYESDELPYLMMVWEMALDGWLYADSDSIGRMEDYDSLS